jgi:hypothetical protein
MLMDGELECSDLAVTKVGTLALGAAFFGVFCVADAFLGFVSVTTDAAGCPALASEAGFGVTAFGLDGFFTTGFLGLTSVAAVAIGCSVLALGAGFGVAVFG